MVRAYAKKPWDLQTNESFQPRVTILVPVHNEEKNVKQKLVNISQVSYPHELIEVIVVDDDSRDKSASIVEDFAKSNGQVRLLRQSPRVGKSAALNMALSSATNSIIVVSDADTLWKKDILQVTLPYLSDPKIGAVTSVGINLNEGESWVTRGEKVYLNLISLMRVGESKLYSTIRFEGGFCAYKREAFDKFDCETGADDSGTALNIVQNGWRTILIPEAVFYTWFPTSLFGKARTKIRRATQLIGLWAKCLKLMVRRRLLLPKRIAVPQFMLFVVNPIVFLTLCTVGFLTVALYPFSFFTLAFVSLIVFLLVFVRRTFVELVVDNLILLSALFSFLLGKRFVSWERR
jgi:cellulose synthase/poly-beta-1,6-N-acetylglucosamine synthase-like glycosyltransferase